MSVLGSIGRPFLLISKCTLSPLSETGVIRASTSPVFTVCCSATWAPPLKLYALNNSLECLIIIKFSKPPIPPPS